MASKADRGTKRTCQNSECEARFYDLNRSPIVCPICQSKYAIASAPEAVVTSAVEDPVVQRKARKPVPVVVQEPDAVEVVEGEEALADVEAAEEAAAGEDDETFLQEEEEEGGDVSNIIGGPVAEGDEEP